MKINDLILLKNTLKDTKVGKMSIEGLRAYLKLSLSLNKYSTEFDEKRKALATEAVENKGYDIYNLTGEQDHEIFNIIAPILDEYVIQDVDVETRVLSWQDLYDGILSLEANDSLTIEMKTRITEMLCSEDL